ncbi:Poly(A) polymerase central domain-containing protein [Immersiella caudata]|uniref:Poly(A) polymerase n=1 Tax=Immersiella caudata TaxID=314043 RepID=A0AA40C347_9PEZI|nr:Poly(A) polymerase central domain-containing protein [Immersiella caudata]
MMERTFGITPPISTALPTEAEKRANEALAKELRAQGTFEPPSETQKREDILKRLQKIADEFVKRAAAEKHPKSPYLVRNARGRIFTYGSYRLGVYGPGSDMDTLVVAPRYVDVDQYFKIFPALLEEMAPPGAITDLNPVPDAFVPIIKFEFNDISIDLIFCPIQSLGELPDDKDWNLHDNNLLRGLTENQVRSLNGTRVTDEILSLVPEPATFRLAIRAIKLWAQRKAIYANILGYPGGIAWNIMVARVCQLYPKATSAVIVSKFFNIMLKWPWPVPVVLKDIEYGLTVNQVAVWNPKIYHGDRHHRMPIITPSYPSMCTTHNVGKSAMAVIQEELEKGAKVTDEIMLGRRPWKDLFTKHIFFTTGFKFYLTVISSSKTREAQNKWASFIESRVRHLVMKLDMHNSIQLARPFNKGYDRVHRCRTDAQIEQVQAGSLAYLVKAEDLEKPEVKTEAKTETPSEPVKTEKAETNGVKGEEDGDVKLGDIPENPENGTPLEIEIYTTNHYIGLQLNEGAKSLDLSREVNEFKSFCMSNDKIFDGELMCLTVQHVRNFDLPDDVFEPGEVKPVKPVKKKRPAATEESAKADAKRQKTAPDG